VVRQYGVTRATVGPHVQETNLPAPASRGLRLGITEPPKPDAAVPSRGPHRTAATHRPTRRTNLVETLPADDAHLNGRRAFGRGPINSDDRRVAALTASRGEGARSEIRIGWINISAGVGRSRMVRKRRGQSVDTFLSAAFGKAKW
jgi:hypothetical protein